ncbi:MAG: YjdF family protein [Methanobacterium paludis]|nr:YjdF family protein [Methanobacterium paludis]
MIDPFWIGIFEKVENGKIEACRVVFGQEPKDSEIYEFILTNCSKLRFSKPLAIDEKSEAKINPKRMQKKIKKAIQENGVGTKAQQAMKLDYESKKIERKQMSKERRELQEELKFQKRQEKKKQKNKGH